MKKFVLIIALSCVSPGFGQSGPISSSNFGFQCGTGNTLNCKNPSPPPQGVWPTGATPGLLRLHDAGTTWSGLNPSSGTFTWNNLDQWLDMIAAHQPLAVAEQFTWVPCWSAQPTQITTCNGNSPPTAPGGSNLPPADLSSMGSANFDAFVTAFVNHCSAAGHCVKDLIKYYQMWNEWDLQFHWTGTLSQLYQMIAPAVAIIRANVTGAIIIMPSTTVFNDTGNGYACSEVAQLNLDATAGPGGTRLSDWIDTHFYLTHTSTTTWTPEQQWANYIANGSNGFLDIRAGAAVAGCTPATTARGWSSIPWVNSESSFDGSASLNYHCPNGSEGGTVPANGYSQFSLADCQGQIVRWQILHDSNGASGLWWYYWNATIGNNAGYHTLYTQMMAELAGGWFAGPATYSTNNGIQTWTAPFVTSNGRSALFAWTPSEDGASYTVPSGYTSYVDASGMSHAATAGQNIKIGVQPFMLLKGQTVYGRGAGATGPPTTIGPAVSATGFRARTDRCATGFASDAVNCVNGATTGQAGSALVFRNQSSDPLPFSQLAPANTAFTGQDFNAYSVIATDTALASTAGISAGAIFNLGQGGHYFAKDNSLLLVNTGGGNTLLLWVDVTAIHNKTCSPAAPCLRYTGIRTSGTTQDATHFTNPLAMSQVTADPANTIFELSGNGLSVNKLTVNGLPACAVSASCTLTRTAYVNFASDTPVPCSVLPADYKQTWTGLFNPANDGSIGFPMGGAGDWHANTATVFPDDFILPTVGNAGNYGFQTTASGTSAGAEPAWCQTSGCTVTDGTATRTNIGKLSGQGPGFDLVVYKPASGCSHVNMRLGKIYRGTGNANPAGTFTTDSPSTAWNLYHSLTVPVALTDIGTLHDAQMELNSTYMQWGPTGGGGAPSAPFTGKQSCRSSGGAENYCYIYVWNIDTLNVQPCQQWTNQGTNTIGHCDAHGLNGQLTRFAGGAFFAHQFNAMNTSAGAANPGTQLFNPALSWDQHGSWNNADATDSTPALMAMTQIPSVGRVNGTGYSLAWYAEDIYLRPDGSGTGFRISHNYNTGSSPDFSVQNAFGVTSMDGTFMAVASDMMETRGAVASPTSQCTSNRGDLPWKASTAYASGNRILPVSNNSNQSIFVNNSLAGTSGTVGNFSSCQTLSSSCVDGSVTWTNLGPNSCRADIFIVDVASAHPAP